MPAARCEAVAILAETHEMSERRACFVIGADRTSDRYRNRPPDDASCASGCERSLANAAGSVVGVRMCC